MQVLGAATAGAAAVVGKATQAVEGTATLAHGALTQEARTAAIKSAEWALGKAEGAAGSVLEGKDRIGRMLHEFQEFLEAWVKQKIQKQIEVAVDELPGVAKLATDDPDMPNFVKRGKDGAIDLVWPDVKEEIMWQVAVVLDTTGKVHGEEGFGPDCIRAFLRYHIYPFDKTFWGKIKSPIWMLFTLASLIPWAGITPLIFLFCFCIIDKTDEFQLISFILQFKGTQFISHGIIKCITGFFLFIACVTGPGRESEHTCETDGPGIKDPPLIVMGGWVLQIVLIWIAFVLLPWAKAKGKKQLKGKIEFTHASSAGVRPGGYLFNLMIYDLICFAACVGVFAYVISTRPKFRHDEWVVEHTFFAITVTYGFLSIPFFLFTLPVIASVLTHAVPTAYDRQGRCVAFKGPPVEKPPRKPLSQFVNADEAQRILGDLREIATGAISGKDAAARIQGFASAAATTAKAALPQARQGEDAGSNV